MTETPETPAPDDKNWTWVLERPCPDCGFDAAKVSRNDFGKEIRILAARYRELLQRDDATKRPSPQVWSALEYGAHVRDVLKLGVERVRLMISKDNPTFTNWDQDETAIKEKYWTQDPAKVAYDLARYAGQLADEFDRVREDQWSRTGLRSDGSDFTVESFGHYFLHDPIHHLWDIERGNEQLAG